MSTINVNRLKQIIREEFVQATKKLEEKNPQAKKSDPLDRRIDVLKAVKDINDAIEKLKALDKDGVDPQIAATLKTLQDMATNMQKDSYLSSAPNPAAPSDMAAAKKPADVTSPANVGGGQSGLVASKAAVVKKKK